MNRTCPVCGTLARVTEPLGAHSRTECNAAMETNKARKEGLVEMPMRFVGTLAHGPRERRSTHVQYCRGGPRRQRRTWVPAWAVVVVTLDLPAEKRRHMLVSGKGRLTNHGTIIPGALVGAFEQTADDCVYIEELCKPPLVAA